MIFRRILLLLAPYIFEKLVDHMLPRPPKPEPENPQSYWQVDLEGNLKYALLDLIRDRKKPPTSVLKALETAVMAAREMDLPREMLDWAELEDEAERQGVDIMDVWFDKTASTR
jgi:hypothetical protein